jgi:hypothetical protein
MKRTREPIAVDPFPGLDAKIMALTGEQMLDTSAEDARREENFRFADALHACEQLRAQGRMKEAKAWTDRIIKEPITRALLAEIRTDLSRRAA